MKCGGWRTENPENRKNQNVAQNDTFAEGRVTTGFTGLYRLFRLCRFSVL